MSVLDYFCFIVRYNVLRRMLPLAILLMSSFVLQKTPSRGLIMSVSLIVAGTLCAGEFKARPSFQ